MKKFKKIICILLVFVSLFSASACSERIIKRIEEKKIAEFEALLNEQQTLIDSFEPDIPGYRLIAEYHVYGERYRELLNEGYFMCHPDHEPEIDYEGKKARLSLIVGSNEESKLKFSLRFTDLTTGEKIKEITFHKNELSEKHADLLFNVYWFYYWPAVHVVDDQIFIFISRFSVRGWYAKVERGSFPTMFFLVDAKNEKLFYLGYIENYFDELRKREYFIDDVDLYKIEKED